MRLIVIALVTLAVPFCVITSATAQHRGDHDRGFEGRGPGFDFNFGGPGPAIHVGPDGFHGRFIGVGRHFWRGTWYDYGVGPCWGLGPDGRYWWICD